jgi:signal transduction histidine kinase
MRLSEFIDSARERIIAESVRYASRLPILSGEPIAVLQDHLPLVLDTIARDLEQPQTRRQSILKSEGGGPPPATESAAQTHGQLRARSGLNVEQLVAEYRVLRSVVVRLWIEAQPPDQFSIDDTMRFNEAIDQAVAESVAFFAAETERWRGIFLGVLGHDLRGPVNAMLLTAEVLQHGQSAASVADHAQSLLRNGRRLEALLDSLLEYNKSRLGVGMVIHRSKVDLAALCREEVDLLRRALPDAQIALEASGDTAGNFDGSRVREALANLVFNAVQYSPPGTPVAVAVRGHDATVQVSVENQSEPIPREKLQVLFEPLRRHSTAGGTSRNLGLGLFIVREIARAHGGDASVSVMGRRMIFAMVFPKAAPVPAKGRP